MMFKDLFVTIAAGVIGVLPVTPPPVVIVTTENVETSVVKYIESYEDRTVTIDCDFDKVAELALKEKESQSFNCVTTDNENKEIFQTKVTLSAHDKKVSITAILDKTVTPDESKPEPATITQAPTEDK